VRADGSVPGLWATEGTPSLTARTRAALIEAVGDGAYPGGRLPAEPELAAGLGVSRTTIRAVLQSLEEDGLVSRRPGRGTYVDAEALRSAELFATEVIPAFT